MAAARGEDVRRRTAERDTRRRRERPAPPWGSFPLTEVVGALALLLGIGSFFVEGVRSPVMLLAALVLGSLIGLELSVREHMTGFRSHSTLLAGGAAVAVVTAAIFALQVASLPRVPVLAVALAAGLAVFATTFLLLRRAFRRRSGGLSFKI